MDVVIGLAIRRAGHRLIVALAFVATVVGLWAGASTTLAGASGFDYDPPASSRLDAQRRAGSPVDSPRWELHRNDGQVWRYDPASTDAAPVARTTATDSVRYWPHNPGPLADDIAATFRSGSYTGEVLQSEPTLYRVYGGESGPIGSYWSRTAPSGPMQAQTDSALNQTPSDSVRPLRRDGWCGFIGVRSCRPWAATISVSCCFILRL